jgi:hypothetical protein
MGQDLTVQNPVPPTPLSVFEDSRKVGEDVGGVVGQVLLPPHAHPPDCPRLGAVTSVMTRRCLPHRGGSSCLAYGEVVRGSEPRPCMPASSASAV